MVDCDLSSENSSKFGQSPPSMKRSRFSEKQTIGILNEQETGARTLELHGISSPIFCQIRRPRRVGAPATEVAGGRGHPERRRLKKTAYFGNSQFSTLSSSRLAGSGWWRVNQSI